MVLKGADGAFGGIAEMYVWGYDLVSDFPVFLCDTLVFRADFVINNLEVDLVALCSEVLHDKL